MYNKECQWLLRRGFYGAAFTAFNESQYNVLDARRRHHTHGIVSAGKPGKQGLGHLTRCGVVMLRAALERHHESVNVEAAGYLAKEIRDPNNLPLSVRKHLSSIAKHRLISRGAEPHEIKNSAQFRALRLLQALLYLTTPNHC